MRRVHPFLLLLSIFLFPTSLFSQTKQEADPNADLAAYFSAETKRMADDCLEGIESLEDWTKKKAELRQQLFEMLGLDPLPRKTDLKLKVTGETEEKEFVVKNVHFQSRPGLYVTGNLYLPKSKSEKKRPAVLYVCGHGRVVKDGVSYGNKVHYHHHGSWFARNGYVCLTIDTLQLGEIEGIHHGTYREKMWWWLNRGYTPAGVEAWNCVRAIDLLQSLPEVDGKRIGVTGRSGGGAYSWWIAAIDERIQCAIPVAGITDLENHVVDGCVEGHCDCMFMVNTYRWDYPLVAAMVAPRPLLISNTDSDRIFPLDGVYRTHEKVKKIYALHNAANKVAFHITAGPHKDTQELRIHAFRWLNHHLKNDDSLIDKPADKFFEPEQLKVFDKLPKDQLNTKIHETFVPAAEVSVPTDKATFVDQSESWKQQLLSKAFRGWPKQLDPLSIKKVSSEKIADSEFLHSRFTFQSQKHVPLDLQIIHNKPLESLEQIQLFVLGNEDQKEFDAMLKDLDSVLGFLKELQEKGPRVKQEKPSDKFAIATVFPRGLGERQWKGNERFHTQVRRRFYLLGQTADSMRVFDTIRTISALKELTKNQKLPVELHAQNQMAGIALYATIFAKDVSKAELWTNSSSHRNGPYFLNVRRILDLPQAVALAANHSKITIHTKDKNAFEYATKIDRLLGRNQVEIIATEKLDE